MRRRKRKPVFSPRAIIKQYQWVRECAVRRFDAGLVGRDEARATVARCNVEIARMARRAAV